MSLPIPPDPEHNDSLPEIATRVGELVASAANNAGDLLVVLGHIERGFQLKFGSPLLGQTATGGIVLAGRRWRRVAEWLDGLRHRAEEQGVADKLPEVEDLIEAATPIASETPSDAKRELLQQLILGTAERLQEEGAKATGEGYLSLVGAMRGEAAVVFAFLARELFHHGQGGTYVISDMAKTVGMSPLLVHRGCTQLISDELSRLLVSNELTGARTTPWSTTPDIRLSPSGVELAEWLMPVGRESYSAL